VQVNIVDGDVAKLYVAYRFKRSVYVQAFFKISSTKLDHGTTTSFWMFCDHISKRTRVLMLLNRNFHICDHN